MKKVVYLSLGSNVGDRRAQLESAIEQLGAVGTVLRVSSFYETAPVGHVHQPDFLNCAVALETERMPRQLLAATMAIERGLGRRREAGQGQGGGPRMIDIDILLFGSAVVDTAELVIPHPALHERRFVLEPLAEIAPEVRHPVLKRSVREMLDALPSGQAIRKLEASKKSGRTRI